MPGFRLFPLLAAAIALSACNQQADVPRPANAKDGIVIIDARLVMPPVAGNPAAAYFLVGNESDADAKIATIDIEGADMAMMHETLDMGGRSTMQPLANPLVKAHQSLEFTPGNKHVMVTGLAPSVKAGTSTMLTITFDDGQKAAVALPVVPPGAAEKPAG